MGHSSISSKEKEIRGSIIANEVEERKGSAKARFLFFSH